MRKLRDNNADGRYGYCNGCSAPLGRNASQFCRPCYNKRGKRPKGRAGVDYPPEEKFDHTDLLRKPLL